MKTFSILLLMMVIAAPGQAQDTRYVHDSGFRWYVSPTKQISQVNGEVASLNGLSAGWIINDRFSVGIFGLTLSNDIVADQPHPDGARNIAFFYSGVSGTYSRWAMPRLQVSASALIGGGEAHWRDKDDGWDALLNRFERDEGHTTSFVAEPRVGAGYALLPWMSIDGAVGYRFVTGGKSNVVEQKDLRGMTGTLSVRFGRF